MSVWLMAPVPKIYLDWSDDGGYTWSSKREASIGTVGNHLPMVVFNRLGSARERVFRISGSDSVKTRDFGRIHRSGQGQPSMTTISCRLRTQPLAATARYDWFYVVCGPSMVSKLNGNHRPIR